MPIDLDRTVYSVHLVYRRNDRWLEYGQGDKDRAAREAEAAVGQHAGHLEFRGVYSAAGLRPDADLVFWLLSNDAEGAQRFSVDLRRTALGRALDHSWTFWGATRPAEFAADHKPAFAKGERPLDYLCVYPFVRTPEWYLLPPEDRGKLLREHGTLGREFPQVLSNTVQAFGLGDWEWILAFEARRPEEFVDLIRRLRAAQARLYTKVEIPFVTCRRKALGEAIADLG